MELKPVEGIRAVGPVGVRRSAGDVAPALRVEAAGRMEEDLYSGSGKQKDRGLEEDAELEENESGEGSVSPGKVDVLA